MRKNNNKSRQAKAGATKRLTQAPEDPPGFSRGKSIRHVRPTKNVLRWLGVSTNSISDFSLFGEEPGASPLVQETIDLLDEAIIMSRIGDEETKEQLEQDD